MVEFAGVSATHSEEVTNTLFVYEETLHLYFRVSAFCLQAAGFVPANAPNNVPSDVPNESVPNYAPCQHRIIRYAALKGVLCLRSRV